MVAAPGCLMVLVLAACVKGAFGVRCADRTSSTLDAHHHDQGRTQLPELLTRVVALLGGHGSISWIRGIWCDRADLGHQAGTWYIWPDVPAPQKVYEVPASAVIARHVAGFVRIPGFPARSGSSR